MVLNQSEVELEIGGETESRRHVTRDMCATLPGAALTSWPGPQAALPHPGQAGCLLGAGSC